MGAVMPWPWGLLWARGQQRLRRSRLSPLGRLRQSVLPNEAQVESITLLIHKAAEGPKGRSSQVHVRILLRIQARGPTARILPKMLAPDSSGRCDKQCPDSGCRLKAAGTCFADGLGTEFEIVIKWDHLGNEWGQRMDAEPYKSNIKTLEGWEGISKGG